MKNANKKIKIKNLPDSELDIMFVLWHSDEPLKAGDIIKILSDTRSWKSSTAHTLLARLEEKGFVSTDKDSYIHYFTPMITEDEYRTAESHAVLTKLCGGSIKKMMASLISSESVTDEDIKELTDMLQKAQTNIENKRRTVE